MKRRERKISHKTPRQVTGVITHGQFIPVEPIRAVCEHMQAESNKPDQQQGLQRAFK